MSNEINPGIAADQPKHINKNPFFFENATAQPRIDVNQDFARKPQVIHTNPTFPIRNPFDYRLPLPTTLCPTPQEGCLPIALKPATPAAPSMPSQPVLETAMQFEHREPLQRTPHYPKAFTELGRCKYIRPGLKVTTPAEGKSVLSLSAGGHYKIDNRLAKDDTLPARTVGLNTGDTSVAGRAKHSEVSASTWPFNSFRKRPSAAQSTLTHANQQYGNAARSIYVWTSASLPTAKRHCAQWPAKSYTKNNEPCSIFQHEGKCFAYERGRCNKRHDRRQVDICPLFLRGQCQRSDCLLSHDVSLSKMPVCKFFLQGICARENCPYLHKKVSDSAEVCQDFLHGFCQLAQACPRRHEFPCANVMRSGVCTATNCPRCRPVKPEEPVKIKLPKKKFFLRQKAEKKQYKSAKAAKRYFDQEINSTESAAAAAGDVDSSACNLILTDRTKLDPLPAFIPLSTLD